MSVGRNRERLRHASAVLTDITPAIVDVLTKETETDGELNILGRAFAQS